MKYVFFNIVSKLNSSCTTSASSEAEASGAPDFTLDLYGVCVAQLWSIVGYLVPFPLAFALSVFRPLIFLLVSSTFLADSFTDNYIYGQSNITLYAIFHLCNGKK